MIPANDHTSGLLDELRCLNAAQLRQVLAHAGGLLARVTNTREARSILYRVADAMPTRPSMADITQRVATQHGLTVDDLRGPRIIADYARARHEAMWRIRQTGLFSLPQIGRYFNRDHSSVLHAVRAHESRLGSPMTEGRQG